MMTLRFERSFSHHQAYRKRSLIKHSVPKELNTSLFTANIYGKYYFARLRKFIMKFCKFSPIFLNLKQTWQK